MCSTAVAIRNPAPRSPLIARGQPTFIDPSDYSEGRVQTAQKGYPRRVYAPIFRAMADGVRLLQYRQG